jgi:hypothetical protein
MYTGYGSYDSGSDYSKAGFDKQVAGTARKMQAWGITPGHVTLARLQAGNNGLLPTGIYATDHAWPNKIYEIYRGIVDDGSVKAADVSEPDPGGDGSSLTKSSKTKSYVFAGICGAFLVAVLGGVLK